MAESLTVGIRFHLDPTWMGGSYYLLNVLSALAMLEPEDQPDLIVIPETIESYEFLKQSGYPKLSYAFAREVMDHPQNLRISVVFPYSMPGMESRTLEWIPDFQERHMPHLFTATELAERTAWHERCLRSAGVLLSSENAHRDLLQFYPEARKVPVFVAPFASFLPDRHPNFSDVRKHYNLPERYFFCANQFWIHKNHVVILAALRELAQEGLRPHVCFSGKEFDSRATGYGAYLRELAQEWGVMEQIHFLGFLPRQDQIAIMEHTVSIIQPSRFEGWSTVIEDAKALNQHVIASDLDVHREQMSTNCDFFAPSDHARLAQLVRQYWAVKPRRTVFDYRKNQRAFGAAILSMFQAMARAHPLPPPPVPDRRSPISSTIPAEDLFGLSYVEGGNGQWDLGTFQWMEGPELLISGTLVPRDAPLLRLAVRNIHEDQRVTLEVNGQRAGEPVGLMNDISRRQELVFDLGAHAGRVCDMKLSVAVTSPSQDRELGLLVENVDFAAEQVPAAAVPG